MRRPCSHDISTLYTTLSHNLIKDELLDLIEWTFKRASKMWFTFLACNDRKACFTSPDQNRYDIHFGHVRMYATLYPISWIIFCIRFGTKSYRQIVGIPMGTKCIPLVADLFLYSYEKEFMDSLNHENQAVLIRLPGTLMTF